jgi:hypothetical protein
MNVKGGGCVRENEQLQLSGNVKGIIVVADEEDVL